MKKIGLKIDVDTYKGTRLGIPNLLNLLNKYNIKASFFFSVGPDNMGRHLWRMCRPSFLLKMIRTRAINLYGLDMLLAGTCWPGKKIFNTCNILMQEVFHEGHEIGFHAWDHYKWQIKINKWDKVSILKELKLGINTLEDYLGIKIQCSAAPGWRINDLGLIIKESFNFHYNSDCRGTHLFRPILNNGLVGTIQIPTTLPTYDEVIGNIVKEECYNNFIINKIINNINISIYTIHAEVEGISKLDKFDNLLQRLYNKKFVFCTLNELIPKNITTLPYGKIIPSYILGREGWISVQSKDIIL
uniref:4-deoxy-4-formamido-L-arabinose-phosphoundecaprenol deformylase n=1 Tax=Candidatus Aschnera chinzeii TaxID=1485666 RepID=A0AAT9G4Z6_9ENTR|nr:MAG: 4-deoxy-4-formamido-L-arabinose-phosphoundecaprenol deformylase [Candidatus Aschnera chinzeii]